MNSLRSVRVFGRGQFLITSTFSGSTRMALQPASRPRNSTSGWKSEHIILSKCIIYSLSIRLTPALHAPRALLSFH